MRRKIQLCFVSGIVGYMIFGVWKVLFIYYFIALGLTVLFLLLQYVFAKNLEVFGDVCLIFFVMGAVLGGIQVCQSGSIGAATLLWFAKASGVMIFMLLASNAIAAVYSHSCEGQMDLREPKLFENRKADLQRIHDYINRFSLIGVEASWGGGKSFLWNHLRKDLAESYEVVEISVLACNIDQLLPILVKNLDDILLKNGVLSTYSSQLKMLLSGDARTDWFYRVLFPQPAGMSVVIEEFKKALAKVNKPIIVMYEDLDRVDDPKIIRQVFAISEKLQGLKMKVLYQYDMKQLERLEFSRTYLEKYLPYTVRLSPVSFFEIVRMFLAEDAKSRGNLTAEDFDIFKEYNSARLASDLQWAFQLPDERLCVDEFALAIRGVKQYIAEAAVLLEEREEYRKNKEVVLRGLFVKHFVPEFFDSIQVYKGLMEQFLYMYEGHQYDFQNIVDGYGRMQAGNPGEIDFSLEKIKEVFLEEKNKKTYSVLNFLGYAQMQVPNVDMCKESQERNIKIDRLMTSLVSSGKKEYTNREYVLQEIKTKIFATKDDFVRTEEQQWKLLEEILGKCYHFDESVDGYTTINLRGHSWFEDLFAAMRVVPMPETMELGLFRLYMYDRCCKENKKSLDMDFLRVCRYCKWSARSILFALLKAFNSLEIKGNFNAQDYFMEFLREMLGALSRRGYLKDGVYRDFLMSHTKDDVLIVVDEVKEGRVCIDESLQKLITEQEDIFYGEEESLEIVRNAMEHLHMLVSAVPMRYEQLQPFHVNIQMQNNGEAERLQKIYSQKGKEAFVESVREAYLAGKLTFHEVERLRKQVEEEAV